MAFTAIIPPTDPVVTNSCRSAFQADAIFADLAPWGKGCFLAQTLFTLIRRLVRRPRLCRLTIEDDDEPIVRCDTLGCGRSTALRKSFLNVAHDHFHFTVTVFVAEVGFGVARGGFRFSHQESRDVIHGPRVE